MERDEFEKILTLFGIKTRRKEVIPAATPTPDLIADRSRPAIEVAAKRDDVVPKEDLVDAGSVSVTSPLINVDADDHHSSVHGINEPKGAKKKGKKE
jgi:hypothetical protein